MVDKKEDEPKGIPTPERGSAPQEYAVDFKQGVGKTLEGPERSPEALKGNEIISAELRKEIEMMQLDPKTKGEAEKKSEEIAFLGEKEKIENLLKIARQKGVIFAIHVARKMNEPYLLDILHDTLASEGYYKDFLSKKNVTDDDDDDDNKKTKPQK